MTQYRKIAQALFVLQNIQSLLTRYTLRVNLRDLSALQPVVHATSNVLERRDRCLLLKPAVTRGKTARLCITDKQGIYLSVSKEAEIIRNTKHDPSTWFQRKERYKKSVCDSGYDIWSTSTNKTLWVILGFRREVAKNRTLPHYYAASIVVISYHCSLRNNAEECSSQDSVSFNPPPSIPRSIKRNENK